MAHPELAAEQAYVDSAYEHLERMRAAVAGAADAVDGEVAQVAMEAWAARRQLVVNWQAPAARAFYTATPQDPRGVSLRRRFRTQGRRLLDISDEALDGSILDGAAVGDFLLEELE